MSWPRLRVLVDTVHRGQPPNGCTDSDDPTRVTREPNVLNLGSSRLNAGVAATEDLNRSLFRHDESQPHGAGHGHGLRPNRNIRSTEANDG